MQTNTEQNIVKPEQDSQDQEEILYRIKIHHSSETGVYVFPDEKPLDQGETVIVPTKYGTDHGIVLGRVAARENLNEEIHDVIRKAAEADFRTIEENRERETRALEICREKVEAHNLDMKLVSAHYLMDEPKVLFFFTAEQRVDFRALVKDLVAEFKMRIELRQIGVRDESRVLGGLGVCGRLLCCHKVTDKLKPVSIKMAKEQNLSLNSMKISGPCGRLLCCLSYEYNFYCEEKKKYPRPGIKIHYGKDIFKISEINILSKSVKLTGNNGQVIEVPVDKFTYQNDQRQWNVELKDFL